MMGMMQMTFTADAKKECARLEMKDRCCILSELAAFVRINGVLELAGAGKLGISMSTENPATARRMYKLIKFVKDLDTNVFVRRKVKLRKNYTYMVSIRPSPKTHDLLIQLGIMDKNYAIIPGVSSKFMNSQCCRRAYLRGSFLASGAVSDPKRGRYHCELLTHDSIHKDHLKHLSSIEGIQWGEVEKKNDIVLYLKDSSLITVLLNLIGATSAALNYENARVYREVRNRVNRLVNSETANLNKTLKAAWRQAEKIQIIDKCVGLSTLPISLREVAKLRVNNPELSLSELALLMKKPISKSAVNYRLRKIEQLADSLQPNLKGKE